MSSPSLLDEKANAPQNIEPGNVEGQHTEKEGKGDTGAPTKPKGFKVHESWTVISPIELLQLSEEQVKNNIYDNGLFNNWKDALVPRSYLGLSKKQR